MRHWKTWFLVWPQILVKLKFVKWLLNTSNLWKLKLILKKLTKNFWWHKYFRKKRKKWQVNHFQKFLFKIFRLQCKVHIFWEGHNLKKSPNSIWHWYCEKARKFVKTRWRIFSILYGLLKISKLLSPKQKRYFFALLRM